MRHDQHLSEQDLTAVVAGLELDSPARSHLADCVACRRAVRATEDVIAMRRLHLEAEAPDLDHQCELVLEAIASDRVVRHSPRWSWRLMVAAAAAVVVILLGGMVWMNGLHEASSGTSPLAANEAPFVPEDVLAEVDAALAEDQIPGFAPLEGLVPGDQDLELLLEEES